MDISKLPRLSKTDGTASPSEPQPAAPAVKPADSDYIVAHPVGNFAAEAWLSVGIGVVLALITLRLPQYISSQLFHTQFPYLFYYVDGSPKNYLHTVFFWNDASIQLFALSLVLEGLVLLLMRRAGLVLFAFAVTLLATLSNLVLVITLIITTLDGVFGLQILPALAVIFGVYIMIFEWKLYRALRSGRVQFK